MRSSALFVVGVAVAGSGCAGSLPSPMMGHDLARLDSGEALLAYLGEPGASPAVCDPRARGPHLGHFDDGVASELVAGLADGEIDPDLWRRCADAALDGAPPEQAAALLDAVARGYRKLVEDADLEKTPALQARAAAIQRLYIERPAGLDAHAATLYPVTDELRRKLDAGKLGPAATRLVWELLAVVHVERGLYGGRPVDLALLDDLSARHDEALLRRFADRLPDQALRDQARRRAVELAIAASPFPEVRDERAAVEARVLQQGSNRVSIAEHPPTGATLAAQSITAHTVLVRQERLLDTLVAEDGGRPPSVLPELSLRGALWVQVPGVSRPITLCRPPRALDPAPCVAPEDVRIESPLVYLDRGGAFHFLERIRPQQATALARAGRTLALPIGVGGQRLPSLEWPLRFERPENLVLTGASGAGPDLDVKVERAEAARFAFTVVGNGAEYRAVLEGADLHAFRVVSRGAPGRSGSNGSNGMDGWPGTDGSSASCPSMSGTDGGRGGDGGNGGNGEDGGNGGDGGNIVVHVDCGATPCAPAELEALRRIVASEGGPGGAGGWGGSGGRGGRGGSGGAGTTCIDNGTGTSSSLSGGTSGSSGSDGANGFAGSSGAAGKPGQIRFSVERGASA
jgi:hypothetical protein